jgi:hypothetical protein
MRLWLLILVLLQLPEPTLLAEWQGDYLLVTASAGSVYLVGGNRGDSYMGSGTIVMPAYGVDINRTPINRTGLILKNASGQVIASLPIPEKPPEVYTVILPLMVR